MDDVKVKDIHFNMIKIWEMNVVYLKEDYDNENVVKVDNVKMDFKKVYQGIVILVMGYFLIDDKIDI